MKTTKRKRLTVLIIISLSGLLLFSLRLEAAENDPFLTRLAGTWSGEGKSLGMSARSQLNWEWVLGGRFLRLSLKNEMRSATGQTQLFEGHAYYRATGEQKFEGTWFDSRGESFSIKGNVDGNALIVLWGTPPRETGRSIYKLLEANKLEVSDSVRQKDGTWREFGQFVVIRQ